MRFKKNYYYLPNEYRKKHDYCEFVVGQIEDLILNKTFIELKEHSFTFSPEFIELINKSQDDFFDLLEQHNFTKELNHTVRNSLLLSLIMETSYFLQESLQCSLKMRMTVCFTLMRKPFLEILIILLRILLEEDFILKFSKTKGFNPTQNSPEEKKELLSKANKLLGNIYVTDDLFDIIFCKQNEESLYTMTNLATHLYSDRTVIKTEIQNLNFIFSTEEDIKSQWEYIYNNTPMIISFLADLIDLLVFKSTNLEEEIFRNRRKKRNELRIANNVE